MLLSNKEKAKLIFKQLLKLTIYAFILNLKKSFIIYIEDHYKVMFKIIHLVAVSAYRKCIKLLCVIVCYARALY